MTGILLNMNGFRKPPERFAVRVMIQSKPSSAIIACQKQSSPVEQDYLGMIQYSTTSQYCHIIGRRGRVGRRVSR